MPPRLSKRQQREQDEISNLTTQSVAQSVEKTTEDPSSSEEAPATKPVASGFAALAQSEHSEEDESEEESLSSRVTKKKHKKKKKKDLASSLKSEDSGQREATRSTRQEDQSNRKRSGKKEEKGRGKTSKEDGDDLDKALAELSLKYPDLQNVARLSGEITTLRSAGEQQNALLAVSLLHLDSEAEMRKFFGAKVISASKAQEKQSRGGRAAIQGLKSNLTRPQPTWWSASQREGLSIRTLTAEESERKQDRSKLMIGANGERWWMVEYSKRYRNVTKAFVRAVMSGDPEHFYRILSKLPWHADTLLQTSEVYRHREEHSSTVDFLNRALFTYERSFIGAFAFTSGTNRLDFDCVESRPFYLALSRMVTDLQRRGCARSAFEFARLLLSLDPYTDPHGALLYLDCLAIKSGMHEWLLSMWDLHDCVAEGGDVDVWNRFNVTTLPGWVYARALALRAKENSKKEEHVASNVALEEAILAFPCVVPLLADKTEIILPGELRGHPAFRVHVDASSLDGYDPLIHLLSHLYVHRSSPLWKIPENAAWFKETAASVFKRFSAKNESHPLRTRFAKQYGAQNNDTEAASHLLHSDLARSIYRHASTLADAYVGRRLTSFFPRELLDAPSLSCDPLPPYTAVSSYDDRFFADCEDIFAFRPRTKREREIDERNLARMIPDANVRHQIQALYDARLDIQQQFPDGVAQFAQVAAQLGEDFWDNLLPELIGEAGAGGVGMPGEFEAFEDEGDDAAIQPDDSEHVLQTDNIDTELDGGVSAEGDRDDRAEAAPVFPVRVWLNLINRFWGGEEPAEDAGDGGATGGERA